MEVEVCGVRWWRGGVLVDVGASWTYGNWQMLWFVLQSYWLAAAVWHCGVRVGGGAPACCALAGF